MYHKLIEDYLTHYQPALKAQLLQEQGLQTYLEIQTSAMLDMRKALLEQAAASEPQISPLQREMEVDQTLRAMFLPLG